MKRGFTLIELLAVIVILAIIALIATPIVLDIIDDTKESAQLRSAENYIKAVEQSVAKKMMDDSTFKPTECSIESGNLNCGGTIVDVSVTGEKPDDGTLTFTEGSITGVELELNGKTIIREGGKLEFSNSLSLSTLQYKIGQEVTFDPGDGIVRNWNVIEEDKNTVTFLLSENLGEPVVWYEDEDNCYGPVTAMNALYNRTKAWTKAEPVNYEYNEVESEYGYTSFVSTNGVATIKGKSNTSIGSSSEPLRARMLTVEEVLEIASKANSNLTEENLRRYLLENLEEINLQLETSYTEVDDVIEFVAYDYDLTIYSKHFQTFFSFLLLSISYEVDMEYVWNEDLLIKFLCQNLYSEISETTKLLPYGYWTLSSEILNNDASWAILYYGFVDYNGDLSIAAVTENFGVRPVITVLKSNLKK